MMDLPIEEIPRHAALAKLGRVLEIDEAELAFLGDVPVADLRQLRDLASDRLHEADEARLSRVAAASRLIPMGLAAAIGQNWFGATLCARLVSLIEPERGGQFARHLDLDFMADITERTDPRLVGDLVHHLPLASMQGIATTLHERDDHLTLSHFVGHIPAEIVVRILEAVTDDAAVVRIAVFVEGLSQLDPIVALLPDERLLALVRAVEAADLWVEGLHLFGHLGPEQVERVAMTLVEKDEAILPAALAAFERHDLWEQGLVILETVSGEQMARVATVLIDLDDELVLAAIRAFDEHDLWHQGLDILANLEGEQIARLATLLARLDDRVLAAAIRGFHQHDLWALGLDVLSSLDGEQIRQVASVLVSLDEEVIDGAVEAAVSSEIWEPLVHAGVAAEHLPPDVRARLAAIIERHGAELAA
ncbi:MAG: hypothetical protein R3249_04440, partial [Nitriliruptorales bacterium]|nr:hypothetical protein [Nitriliruptorales bacterium]